MKKSKTVKKIPFAIVATVMAFVYLVMRAKIILLFVDLFGFAGEVIADAIPFVVLTVLAVMLAKTKKQSPAPVESVDTKINKKTVTENVITAVIVALGVILYILYLFPWLGTNVSHSPISINWGNIRPYVFILSTVAVCVIPFLLYNIIKTQRIKTTE